MRERAISWRQVSRGCYLLGAGVFLILNTQGLLPWSFWLDALAYWPVLLVALGIRLVFERSSVPWAILIAPLLVFGGLAYLATQAPGHRAHANEPLSADRPAGTRRWTFEADLSVGDLRVAARPLPGGRLLEGRADEDGGARVGVTERQDAAVVRVRRRRWPTGIVILPGPRRTWDLGLAPDLPLAINLDLAFIKGTFDLADAPVTRVDCDGVFNDIALRLGVPDREVRLGFDGAFNHLRIEVPAPTPVRVLTDGFLNVVDGRSTAGSRAGPGYRLRIEGAFNSIEVRSP